MKKIKLVSIVFFVFLFTIPAFASTYRFVDGTTGTGNFVNGRFVTRNNTYLAGSASQVEIDGKFYRFNESGGLISGWFKDGGVWYYYDATSFCQGVTNGWKQIDGIWYYFNTAGEMLSSTYTPDGYWVDANGAWNGSSKTSTRATVKTVATHSSSGHTITDWNKATGWYQSGGNWYYLKNGDAVTGWKKSGNYWYYLDEDGIMVTGWYDIDSGYNDSTRGSHTYFFYPGTDGKYPEGAMLKSVTVDGVKINKFGIADDDL